MARRVYTDAERATAVAAVAANGGNIGLTAHQLGIPDATLRNWCSGRRHPLTMQLAEGKKAELSDKFEHIAHRMLDHADTCVEELDAKEAVTSAAICVDKMRLLRDQPTDINRDDSNPDLSGLSDEELVLYEQLKQKIANTQRRAKGTGP